ncbi:hypothetical protein M427DRAFT_129857 [Gonapodya prolifera JEL478]|uniref:Zinc finger PHD-type domain-containing protein n=1 Tax=Gonapodya prolifera (strain JEL478) TaxID=1344416 RepID=A0A139AZE4_GONPJ|nr:hypothetical protein M427DRAFT_129857 [Gonapodya prolifera JEL478]|eukprot:KXS22089.1 hypothetical protein M427DRAFT_129857 [Gonapodya prolifera JEL478]
MATVDEPTPDADDNNDSTRCVCGKTTSFGLMIQCEECGVWQHGECVNIPSRKYIPKHYYCDGCRPEDHPYNRHLLYAKTTARKPHPSASPGGGNIHPRPIPKKRQTLTSMEAAQNFADIMNIEGKAPSEGRGQGSPGPLKRKRGGSADSGDDDMDDGEDQVPSDDEQGVDGRADSGDDTGPSGIQTAGNRTAMEVDNETAAEAIVSSSALARRGDATPTQHLQDADPEDSETSSDSATDERPTRRRQAKRPRASAPGGAVQGVRRRPFGKRQAPRRPTGGRKGSANGDDDPDDDDGTGSVAEDGGAPEGDSDGGEGAGMGSLVPGGRSHSVNGTNTSQSSRPARTVRREPDRESTAAEGYSDEDGGGADEEEDEGRWDDPDFGTGKPIARRNRGSGSKTVPGLGIGRHRGGKVGSNPVAAGYARGGGFKRGRGGWGATAVHHTGAIQGGSLRSSVVDDASSGKDSRFASGSYSDAAPIKSRVPNPRASIMEMNRRVKQLWEWCGRTRGGMGLNPTYDPDNETVDSGSALPDGFDGQSGDGENHRSAGTRLSNVDADFFDVPTVMLLERFSRRLYEFRREFMVFGMARGAVPVGNPASRAPAISTIPPSVTQIPLSAPGEDVAAAALLAAFSGSASIGTVKVEAVVKEEKMTPASNSESEHASRSSADRPDLPKSATVSDSSQPPDLKGPSASIVATEDGDSTSHSPTSDKLIPNSASATETGSGDKDNDNVSVRTGADSEEDDEDGDNDVGEDEEEGDFVEAGRRRRRTTNTVSSGGARQSRGKGSRGRGRGPRGGRSTRGRRGGKSGNTTPPGDQEESDTESTEASVRGRNTGGGSSSARRKRRSN